MSGSGHQRKYDTLNKTIVNASDYIQKKRDSTRWKALSNGASKKKLGSTINPRKKNGYYYQDNYFATAYSNDNSGCIVAAKSYDLLQSISRGKYYANPVLNGIEVLSGGGMWTGNITQIKYQTGCDFTGSTSSCGNYYAPIRLTNLYNSTDTSSPYWGGASGYDFTPFPNFEEIQFSGYHNGLIPGFIIDPSNTIFYKECIQSKSNSPSWVENGLVKLAFTNTLYYWKGVNAQPLSGYSFPQPISLNYQAPDPSGKYLPLIPGTSRRNNKTEENATDLLDAWCKGLSAIN